MPIQAKVIANGPAGAHVRKLTLELQDPAQWTFLAGQFVIIPVPRPSTGPGQALDAKPPKGFYSIASSPAELPKLELLIEHRPEGGYVSGWMSSRAAGDLLTLDGPMGHFGLQAGDADGRVFLGYRAGIAPLRSLLLASLGAGTRTPHWLFLGAESAADLLLDEEWRALDKVDEHFHYLPVLGPEGDPAEAFLKAVPLRSSLHIYMAGFSKDVEPLKARLLAAGVAESAIKVEKFG
jgi:ferredoxin-NADP reductase